MSAPAPDPTRCAVSARARADALDGTALPNDRFLLVEDPGPWGDPPHPVGSLPPAAVDSLHGQARAAGARLLLIRRTGRRPPDPARVWAFADVAAGTVRAGRAGSPDALADVDVAGGGRPDPDPWYLVCAQGRHDVCCAIFGRPVVQALDSRLPGRTWECSHVGGDRFAATLLLLPAGLMYGRLDPGSALDVVRAHLRGAVVPAHLRGRCGIAPAAQVAESHARGYFGDVAVDALRAQVIANDGAGRWSVEVTQVASGATVRVELAEQHRTVPAGLTCDSPGPGRLREWGLVRLSPQP